MAADEEFMTTNRLKCGWIAAIAAAAWSTTALAVASPQIINGSFESPAEAPNSITEITQTGIPGWTGDSIGGAAHEYIINGNVQDTFGRYFGTPTFGQQYLGLNGIQDHSFASIETQVVTGLVVGQTYDLSLYFANLDGATDPDLKITAFNETMGIDHVLASQTFVAPVEGPHGQGAIDFVPESLTFTADSDVVNVSLANDSYTGVLAVDNVSLSLVSSAPEPSTWMLLVVGVGLSGVALRYPRRAPAKPLQTFGG